MKKGVFCLTMLLAIIGVQAQECNAALFLKEGASLTYTNYDKKGKKLSKTVHQTLSVDEINEGYEATFKATVFDKRDTEEFTSQYTAGCKDGLFSMDMLRFFDMSKLSEHNDPEVDLEIEGSVLSFPVQMSEGDQLEDGDIQIKVNKNDFTLVTMTFWVFNRKVQAQESVTTTAGNFDCQVVTFDFESKFGILKIKGSGKEWYLDDKVVVKSESYNKKGKLMGYHELTAME